MTTPDPLRKALARALVSLESGPDAADAASIRKKMGPAIYLIACLRTYGFDLDAALAAIPPAVDVERPCRSCGCPVGPNGIWEPHRLASLSATEDET